MRNNIEDIAGGIGLLALSAGTWVNFGLGWGLIVFGLGLFGTAVLVSWVTSHAATPTE